MTYKYNPFTDELDLVGSGGGGGGDHYNARFIVGDTTKGANYATLGAALAAASSGDVVYLQQGTYTIPSGSVTLVPGVLIAGESGADLFPQVTIDGGFDMSVGGTFSFANIYFNNTNGERGFYITATDPVILNLQNCFLNINVEPVVRIETGASALTTVNLYDCVGDNTGGTQDLFNYRTPANTNFYNCTFFNSGGYAASGGDTIQGPCNIYDCRFYFEIDIDGGNVFNCLFDTSAVNTTALYVGVNGTLTTTIKDCVFKGGTATPLELDVGVLNLIDTAIDTTNTNAILNFGTINYSNIVFTNTGEGIGGTLVPLPTVPLPITENVTDITLRTSAIAVPTGTPTDIASVTLTAGTWDIYGALGFAGTFTGTNIDISVNTTSATNGTFGDNLFESTAVPNASADASMTLPPWRQTFLTTTTVYLIADASYSVGALFCYGKLSANRVSF
jgi:hypothetical protein